MYNATFILHKLLELKYVAKINTHNLVIMSSYAAQRMPVTRVLIEEHIICIVFNCYQSIQSLILNMTSTCTDVSYEMPVELLIEHQTSRYRPTKLMLARSRPDGPRLGGLGSFFLFLLVLLLFEMCMRVFLNCCATAFTGEKRIIT